MHSLHKILVNVKQFGDMERSELMSAARSFAEAETERFCETAYDWRKTDSAGGWSDEYPENVILGKETPEQILKEVLLCRAFQESELNQCIHDLGVLAKRSLEELKQILWASDTDGKSTNESIYSVPHLIKTFGRILDGDYYFDSMFYDTSDYTAKISSKTIEEIKSAPQDWALVFFDYHF